MRSKAGWRGQCGLGIEACVEVQTLQASVRSCVRCAPERSAEKVTRSATGVSVRDRNLLSEQQVHNMWEVAQKQRWFSSSH